jgi:hypothetical protein
LWYLRRVEEAFETRLNVVEKWGRVEGVKTTFASRRSSTQALKRNSRGLQDRARACFEMDVNEGFEDGVQQGLGRRSSTGTWKTEFNGDFEMELTWASRRGSRGFWDGVYVDFETEFNGGFEGGVQRTSRQGSACQ